MQTIFHRNRVLVLHLAFWGVYLSFFLYQISAYQRGPEFDWHHILVVTGIQVFSAVVISYLNYFYFLPRFLARKNLWRYLAEFAVPFALIMFGRLHVERWLLDNYSGHFEHLYRVRFMVQVVTTNLFIVIFVGLIRFAVDWFELDARKKSIENEKLTAELNFLKAQINPHFLFNTLNNLYYLAYTQSPNTTEVIARLSQMMRYMIYDTNHPKVPLRKEIEYMESYISLERLRLNNQIPIVFEVQGDYDRLQIVPLIFITFLENAFKHGVTNNAVGAWVTLSIKLKDNECIYTVENSKVSNLNTLTDEKSGIGLQNVRRRLDLSYPDAHTLTIDDQPDRYRVQLKITLA